MKPIKVTNCEPCPCLNNDYEFGNSCNLEYEIDYYRYHSNIINGSTDCKLTRIFTKDGGNDFIPEYVMATKD